MQLHAERAQFAAEAVKVVERALEEGRCRLAGAIALWRSTYARMHCCRPGAKRRAMQKPGLAASSTPVHNACAIGHSDSTIAAVVMDDRAIYCFKLLPSLVHQVSSEATDQVILREKHSNLLFAADAAEPDEEGSEVMSAEMLSDAVMVASSILSARAAGGQTEARSVKLAQALAQLSGTRTTIVVRARSLVGRHTAVCASFLSWRCM